MMRKGNCYINCCLRVALNLLQLQDAGYWTDAATLAATHLKGSDYARFCSILNLNLAFLMLSSQNKK